jgi:RNA polymerase sigma factor (TIGR02999 family)
MLSHPPEKNTGSRVSRLLSAFAAWRYLGRCQVPWYGKITKHVGIPASVQVRRGSLPQEQYEPSAAPAAGAGQFPSQLFEQLYDELRRIARRELQRRGRALTLGATTLLHEVYLNMRSREDVLFPDRGRFLAYASRAMRGLIIDYARSRQALKRGGAFEITSFPTDVPDLAVDSVELQHLSDAIERLAAVDSRLAQVIDLKYFGGFSFSDIAAMQGISERTVQRDWEKARLFLHRCLSAADAQP